MYDKQKLKYVITKYHRSDNNKLEPTKTVIANIKFMELIDNVVSDDEKITWNEFMRRCKLCS